MEQRSSAELFDDMFSRKSLPAHLAEMFELERKQELIDRLPENLGLDEKVCANCRSFPVEWIGQRRHCKKIETVVEFDTPACEAIKSRRRPERFLVAREKVSAYKDKLNGFSKRLQVWPRRPYSGQRLKLIDIDCRMKKCKKAIDEEVKGVGKHKHFRQLRNLRGDAVYVVDCGDGTKIGYTSDPVWKRMRGLLNGNPGTLTLIGVCPGTRNTEKKLQIPFMASRIRGDWFRLNETQKAELLAMVKRQNGQILDPPVEFK